jgi:hypothetical protein
MTRQTGAALAAMLMGLAVRAGAQQDAGASMIEGIEAKREVYADVAKQIWGFAEVGYQEQKSSALLQEQLKAAGFEVRAGVADIPTAFTATYGTGRPVIGIVGEFDALPSLSQEVSPSRKPLVDNAPGHGCGHNLLGTGSVAAAIAVKEWLASTRRSGTLRFFGTPAEEEGSCFGRVSSATSIPSLHGIPAIVMTPAPPATLQTSLPSSASRASQHTQRQHRTKGGRRSTLWSR